jgi:regulation of enolase protein 1 (concanavalin A-like superfamily)
VPAPTGLTAAVVSSTEITLAWSPATADAVEIERATGDAAFAPHASVAGNVSSTRVSGLTSGTTYRFRIRAVAGTTRSAFSNIASVTTPAGPVAPVAEWQAQDIGAVAAAGSSSEAAGTITLNASGADIWDNADEFHFRHLRLDGDGELVARITSLTNTHAWAKAGIMLRESLTPDSRHAFLCVGALNPAGLQRRLLTGGGSTAVHRPQFSPLAQWLRLVREGNTISGFVSANGSAWTHVDTITVDFPSRVYLGLALTSHNDGVLSTATFDHVELRGTGTPPPPPPPTVLAAPTGLTATTVAATQITLGWTNTATSATGVEVERSVDGTVFTAHATLPGSAASTTVSGLTPATTYHFRVRAIAGTTSSAFSNTATSVTAALPENPPADWQSNDIGGVAAIGSSTESGGTITVAASGADIWDNADEFHYRYQSWTGDGEMIARIDSFSAAHGWAKAGLMFRDSLSSSARHVFMCASFASGTAFQRRAVAGGGSATTSGSGRSFPWWLRLVRTGNTFTGYESPDGATWARVGEITLDLPATALVGLAVTSHQDGALATARFSQVRFSGGTTPPANPPPPPVLSAPRQLVATSSAAGGINLAWEDASANEEGFEIERSANDASFQPLSRTVANTTSYLDATASAGQTYNYRVRAVAGSNASAYSNSAAATAISPPVPPSTTPWLQGDIGFVGQPGSHEASGNTITLRGSGGDIWENADGFRFLYRAIEGDVTVEAQVASLTATHGWAKAGVMLRETLDAGARNVFALLTPGNGAAVQHRAVAGGSTAFQPGPWGSRPPHWVRLVRRDAEVRAYSSFDGITWTLIQTVPFSAARTLYVGFAVTAHDNSQLATAILNDPYIGPVER